MSTMVGRCCNFDVLGLLTCQCPPQPLPIDMLQVYAFVLVLQSGLPIVCFHPYFPLSSFLNYILDMAAGWFLGSTLLHFIIHSIQTLQQSQMPPKPLIFLAASVALVPAMVYNIWLNGPAYDLNLNQVPLLQSNPVLGSPAFLTLMNIVSNIFNPILCAGYVMAFYLLSHRRFEILVFLLWFIGMSVLLTFLKELIQQARPYWIAGSGVKMLEWTCYSEFGCPSGHSMLGLVLVEFVVRYYAREYRLGALARTALAVAGVVLQGLVVFSRIILGMHSINQVLFGLVLGFYSILAYYLYAEKALLKLCLRTCSRPYMKISLAVNTFLVFLLATISLLLTFVLDYPNNPTYFAQIATFESCQSVKLQQSFQYKCLQDSALAMAAFGTVYGLIFLREQDILMRVVAYPRSSLRYVARVLMSAVVAGVPVGVFMNPWWKRIEIDDAGSKAVLLYTLQGLGLGLACFVLVGLAPAVLAKLKLEQYFSHHEGRPHLFYDIDEQTQTPITSKQSQSRLLSLAKQQNYNKNDSINVPV